MLPLVFNASETMRKATLTMREMLEELSPVAARAEWHEGRTASKLAKIAPTAATREVLYGIKNRCVSHAVQLCPKKIYIGDLLYAAVGIIGVGLAPLGQLHVPVKALSRAAREVVARKLRSTIDRLQTARVARAMAPAMTTRVTSAAMSVLSEVA